MANILEVAMAEFAEKGLAGARIDEIAAATHTSKRMIYYYFGSKEGLYLAVLEQAYARMRAIESQLDLDNQDPESALRRLVEETLWHEVAHYFGLDELQVQRAEARRRARRRRLREL